MSVIQSKLFDFDDGVPTFGEVRKKRLSSKKVDKEEELGKLGLDEFGHYYLINPVCPKCGSKLSTLHGLRPFSLLNDEDEKVEIKFQRYGSSDCGYKYSGSIISDKKKLKKSIREKNHFF